MKQKYKSIQQDPCLQILRLRTITKSFVPSLVYSQVSAKGDQTCNFIRTLCTTTFIIPIQQALHGFFFNTNMLFIINCLH